MSFISRACINGTHHVSQIWSLLTEGECVPDGTAVQVLSPQIRYPKSLNRRPLCAADVSLELQPFEQRDGLAWSSAGCARDSGYRIQYPMVP
jgi:hypothetical protein